MGVTSPGHVVMTAAERQATAAAVELALREDLGPSSVDLTSAAVAGVVFDACIVARAPGVLAGCEAAAHAFRMCGVEEIEWRAADGERVQAQQTIATVRGPAAAVLSAERVALNFLQRLSGIASLVAEYVAAVDGSAARIYDTRKTTPGLRALERHAVRCGGGCNHRFGLFDVAMLKDNHIDAVGIEQAASRIRQAHPQCELVVEARTLAEVEAALAVEPQVILLDNMDPDLLRQAVALIGGAAQTEASGGITLENVAQVAAAGVDRISVGAITHSAPALDIALDARAGADPGGGLS